MFDDLLGGHYTPSISEISFRPGNKEYALGCHLIDLIRQIGPETIKTLILEAEPKKLAYVDVMLSAHLAAIRLCDTDIKVALIDNADQEPIATNAIRIICVKNQIKYDQLTRWQAIIACFAMSTASIKTLGASSDVFFGESSSMIGLSSNSVDAIYPPGPMRNLYDAANLTHLDKVIYRSSPILEQTLPDASDQVSAVILTPPARANPTAPSIISVGAKSSGSFAKPGQIANPTLLGGANKIADTVCIQRIIEAFVQSNASRGSAGHLLSSAIRIYLHGLNVTPVATVAELRAALSAPSTGSIRDRALKLSNIYGVMTRAGKLNDPTKSPADCRAIAALRKEQGKHVKVTDAVANYRETTWIDWHSYLRTLSFAHGPLQLGEWA